jgi:hypothetical protein
MTSSGRELMVSGTEVQLASLGRVAPPCRAATPIWRVSYGFKCNCGPSAVPTVAAARQLKRTAASRGLEWCCGQRFAGGAWYREETPALDQDWRAPAWRPQGPDGGFGEVVLLEFGIGITIKHFKKGGESSRLVEKEM